MFPSPGDGIYPSGRSVARVRAVGSLPVGATQLTVVDATTGPEGTDTPVIGGDG